MASVDIKKFFKWGSYSGTKTVEQITTALGTIISHTPDSEGIGFLVSGDNNEIVGITAKDAKVNFKSLGGGTLGTAAATSGQDAHGPQITLTKNTGTDAVNLATAQNSYLTITADNAGTVTFGTTQGVYDSTASTPAWTTPGLVNNTELEKRLTVMATAEAVTIANATGANTVILSQGGTAVDNTLTFGVISQTGYNLTQDLATANAINYGYDTATLRALGRGDEAVASVTANNGTVTVKTHAGENQDTTNTFNVIQSATVDAAATSPIASNGAVDIKTTATALGTGSYPATPTKTDAYQGDNNAANYNPLSTKSYVDASIAAIPAADTYNLQANAATNNIAQIALYSNNGQTSTWAGGFGLRTDGSITLTSTGTPSASGFGYSLGHANSVTAESTQSLLKIAYDAHGHITGSTAVQSSDIAGLFTNGGDATATVLTTAANTPTDAAPWTTSYTFNTTVEQNDLLIGTGATSETIYVSKAVTATNPIVTKDDLSGIVGAMVYKGAVNSNSDLPTTGVQPGWTYVVATAGTYAGQACEVGDMIIAKDSTPNWNVISGENQVINPGATVTADAANATTIATIDGTDITLKVASSADTVKTSDLEDLKLQKDSLTYSNGTWTEGSATDVVTYDTQAAVTQVEHSLGLVLNGTVVTYNPLVDCTHTTDPFAWEEITIV